MPLIPVDSLADPRLDCYRNLKDRDLARLGDRFIAEGEQVVRRLLSSVFTVDSMLVAMDKAPIIAPLAPVHVPIYAAAREVMEQIIGFRFHSGVLACAFRPQGKTLQNTLRTDQPRMTILACQEIANNDNLGALIRIAAAFGVDALLLGERCCDPFFRHSVRVSMGAAFAIPIIRSINLIEDLNSLREHWQMQSIATVLHPDAEKLPRATRPPRLVIVFGNEAQGLDAATIAACDRKITLPMRSGTDSLNVANAAAVFLYHFTHVQRCAAEM